MWFGMCHLCRYSMDHDLCYYYIKHVRVGELTPNGFSGCSVPALLS